MQKQPRNLYALRILKTQNFVVLREIQYDSKIEDVVFDSYVYMVCVVSPNYNSF